MTSTVLFGQFSSRAKKLSIKHICWKKKNNKQAVGMVTKHLSEKKHLQPVLCGIFCLSWKSWCLLIFVTHQRLGEIRGINRIPSCKGRDKHIEATHCHSLSWFQRKHRVNQNIGNMQSPFPPRTKKKVSRSSTNVILHCTFLSCRFRFDVLLLSFGLC